MASMSVAGARAGRNRAAVLVAALICIGTFHGSPAAFSSDACPPPNAPTDAPGGRGPGLNPVPGSGPGPTTGGGAGPTTGGPGFLPGRTKEPVTDLPPATTDPAGGLTTWVRWWERNKEVWLRYAERMRQRGLTATPGGQSADEAARVREAQDLLVREALGPVFRAALDDESPNLRATAAVALGRCGSADASKALRTRIDEDRHPAVRETCVMALGLVGRAADAPYLAERLADRSLEARGRGFAALSLGLIGGDDASAVLAAAVRRAATDRKNREDLDCTNVLALGLTETQEAAEVLLRVVSDRRYRDTVQAAALVALGRMSERRALVPASDALKSPSGEIRAAGALALGRLAQSGADDVVELLVQSARKDADPIVRHFAILSLGRLGGPRTADRLQVLFLGAKGDDRPFAAIAMGMTREASVGPLLREAFADGSSDAELSGLAIALGLHGDEQGIPLLRKSLEGRRTQWHEAYAATALAMLGDRASAKPIRERLLRCRDDDVRRHLAVALGLLGDRSSADVLRRELETARDDADRGAAAMALGLLRDGSAVPTLVAAARSRGENVTVRACSLSALAQIADPLPVPKLARIVADDVYSLGIDPVDRVWVMLNRR